MINLETMKYNQKLAIIYQVTSESGRVYAIFSLYLKKEIQKAITIVF